MIKAGFFMAITIACMLPLSLKAENITVSTPKELLENIRSGNTITVKTGTYKLDEVSDLIFDNVVFQDAYDGKEAIVNNVKNIKIIGEPGVRILAKPRYGWVFKFNGCESWYMENITFGHEEGGYCEGGVISLEESKTFSFKSCKFFGSGTIGMSANRSEDIKMESCEIYECTYGLLSLADSKNISFNKTVFRNTGEYDLIGVSNVSGLSFNECSFLNNFTSSEYFPYFFTVSGNGGSGSVMMKKCTFTGNKVLTFSNNATAIKLIGCTFSNNTFAQPK